MPKKSTKSLSKRQTLADKYRVEKRVKAHRKKVKKEAKKNPKWKSKLKKDPGIPNLYPFKEKLLSQVKESHEVEERAKKRLQKQSMAKLAKSAEELQTDFERRQAALIPDHQKKGMHAQNVIPKTERDSSRKAFYKEFKKVVEDSDVILEVLDARDPIGCRARAVEQAILEKGNKKIVLVLNKIDLVPREVVAAWLTHLRHEFPTVAFRCNTQSQRSHLSRGKHDYDTYDSLSGGGVCLGGDTLLELLKNYCRSQDLKKSITVGIIGYPNTGKSSLINSLKRSKAAAVGAKPGFTRQMKEIKLDANVVLLDCPGIVFSAGEGDYSSADIVLRNAVEMEKITDPVPVIDAVLKRCPRERLMELYQIPLYKSSEEFLALISHKIGRLKKGGIPDYKAAAVSVLRDWQSGKIKFYTMPPEKTQAVVSSTIVTQWAKEFDLDAIVEKEASSVMSQLPSQVAGALQVESAAERAADSAQMMMSDEDSDLEEDDQDEEVDEMELSSEYEDEDEVDNNEQVDQFANSNASDPRGAMVMMLPKGGKAKKSEKKQKRVPEEEQGDYDMVPVSRGKKKKQLKRDKKLSSTGPASMDVDYEDAPFDFEEFEPVAVSDKTPDAEQFEFNY